MIANIDSNKNAILKLFNFSNRYRYQCNISLKDLMLEVRNKKIISVKEYQKNYKKYNWPSSPHETYKKEWISYNHFFGTHKYKCRKISLKDLMKEVRNKKITSTKKYRSVYKKYGWPGSPDDFYKNEWVSFGHLCGKLIYKCKKISLRDLTMKVRNKKINSVNKYRMVYKKHKWPAAPHDTYKKDWISWNHFFGNEEKKFLTWEEIVEDVRNNNIQNMDQYMENRKSNWPSNPNQYYKEWHGSRHFFTGVKTIYLKWDEFCLCVRKSKIKTSTEYKQKRKENWPKFPMGVYKEHWKGWHHLCFGEIKNNDWPDFQTLHEEVLKMELKSQDEYKKYRKPNWPSHPYVVYKEFDSWYYFLQGKTAEEISNETCTQLCEFIKKNKRTPSRSKGKKDQERKLYSYLERRRRGDQKPYSSDLKIAKKMGFSNLFESRNLEQQSNEICKKLCSFIKKNKRVPSSKSKDKYERSLKSWMWSRLTCKDKKWQKKVFKSDLDIIRKQKLYETIFGNNEK